MRNPILTTVLAAALLWAGAAAGQQDAPAAAPDAAALIAAAPAAADLPDADAVVLHESVTFTVDDAGRLGRRVHRFTKLFSEWACRNLSDLRPAWDADRQELVVHVCRTTMADGRVVDTPQYGFNEVTPDGVARCPDFLGLREMVISHVAVERGAVLEIDYEVRDLQPGPLPACGLEFLQGELPILHKTVRVSAPGEVSHAQLHTAVEPAVAREAGRTGLVWTVRDVPALPAERNAARRGDHLPHVVFGVQRDWTAFAHRLAELSGFGDVEPELRAWLDQEGEEFAGAVPDLSARATVERVARLLGSGLRTVRTPDPWIRAPRPPARILDSAYGTPWEQAVLALQLLRGAGLKPELAVFSRWETLATGVPAPVSFAELRVVAAVGDEHYWLAPGADAPVVGRCDLTGRTGMFLEDTPKGYRRYTVPHQDSSCVLAADVRPAPDGGFAAEIEFDATHLFRRAEDGRDAEALAAALATAVLPDAEVTAVRLLVQDPDAVRLRVSARAEELGEALDDGRRLSLPAPPHGLLDLLPDTVRPAVRARATPVFLGGERREVVRLRLTLPEGLALDRAAPAIDRRAELAACRQTAVLTGRVLEVTRELTVREGVVAPADWPAFRAVLAVAAAPASRELTLLPE